MRHRKEVRLIDMRLGVIVFTALCAAPLHAADPCCTVVSIDKPNGVVTLRDTKTGKLDITVKDRTQLAKLAEGQPADRSIGKRIRYCSIATFERVWIKNAHTTVSPARSELTRAGA